MVSNFPIQELNGASRLSFPSWTNTRVIWCLNSFLPFMDNLSSGLPLFLFPSFIPWAKLSGGKQQGASRPKSEACSCLLFTGAEHQGPPLLCPRPASHGAKVSSGGSSHSQTKQNPAKTKQHNTLCNTACSQQTLHGLSDDLPLGGPALSLFISSSKNFIRSFRLCLTGVGAGLVSAGWNPRVVTLATFFRALKTDMVWIKYFKHAGIWCKTSQ